MLKLFIHAKMNYIESSRVIEEIVKFKDIYKFVCDRISPDECSIQRYCNYLGCYYEVALQMTLKRL